MRVQAPFEAWSTGMACFIERNTVMVSDFWYDQIFQRLDEKFIRKWRKLILAKLLMVIRHGRGYGFVSLRGTQWWSLFFDTINDLRDRIKIIWKWKRVNFGEASHGDCIWGAVGSYSFVSSRGTRRWLGVLIQSIS